MQAVYRPYLHPRLAPRLAVPVLASANAVGAASTSMVASVQAAGVVIASAAAAVAIGAQAQEGSFTTFATGTAAVEASVQASGVLVGTMTQNPAGLAVSAIASGRATRAGEGMATATVSMTLQATGVRIVPGEQPGASTVDMAAFIERKVERAAEYRFSGGGVTRDFYQRGN